MGWPRRRDLVETVRAVDDPYRLGAEIFQHVSKRLDPLAREHADHLPLDAGGVREGAQQVEDGASAEFDPRWADIFHRWVVRGREHETDAGLLEAPTDPLRRQFDVHPAGREHVRRARARRARPGRALGY